MRYKILFWRYMGSSIQVGLEFALRFALLAQGPGKLASTLRWGPPESQEGVLDMSYGLGWGGPIGDYIRFWGGPINGVTTNLVQSSHDSEVF